MSTKRTLVHTLSIWIRVSFRSAKRSKAARILRFLLTKVAPLLAALMTIIEALAGAIS